MMKFVTDACCVLSTTTCSWFCGVDFSSAVRRFPLIGVTEKIALRILNLLRVDQEIEMSGFKSGKTSASQELSYQQLPESCGITFQNADFRKACRLCGLVS